MESIQIKRDSLLPLLLGLINWPESDLIFHHRCITPEQRTTAKYINANAQRLSKLSNSLSSRAVYNLHCVAVLLSRSEHFIIY
jgi:hypothetical protein